MKSKGLFHFKKFSLSDRDSTHKIGTDGVLLGAWTNVDHATRVLDIGTGSGVIALMLAQRSSSDAIIEAIDIHEHDVEQARQNVLNSPWPDKVIVHHSALQHFKPDHQFDLIVSNPPYFINSWLPPDERRGKARHTEELTFPELVDSTSRLMTANGKLGIILPTVEAEKFIAIASQVGLHLHRKLSFQSRTHKPIERILMEFGKENLATQFENLVLYSEGEIWSDAYRKLTRDFYLRS